MKADYFFNLLCWITIIVQLISTIVGIKAWHLFKHKPAFWLSIYSCIEFVRSLIGYLMAASGINNHGFYWYSKDLSALAIFIFGLSLIQEKKLRKYVSIVFAISLLISFTLALLQTSIEIRNLIRHHQLLQISVSAFILRDKVKNNNGLPFKNDPWTIIALVILGSQSISLLSIYSRYFFVSMHSTNVVNILMNYINCFAILFCYLLITIQLKKLKNLTLT